MYNLNNTLFASDGGFILSTITSSNPVYVKIHNNFAPLKYWIVGIDNFEIKGDGQGFIIDANIDEDMVLGVQGKGEVSIKMFYLGVGANMGQVCGTCVNVYAMGDNCVNKCPQNTYPY